MLQKLQGLSRKLLPPLLRHQLVRATRWPPVGRVNFENLRRLEPISHSWGGDRGQPIDRYYIEQFLEQHRSDISGHVMEIGDNQYTRRFGGKAVSKSDVLHMEAGLPGVTIVADLAHSPHLSDNQFDCIICTQTLQFIPNMLAAVFTLHRLLKPDGVLLVTGPANSPLGMDEARKWGDFWRFTTFGMRHLLSQAFALEMVTVQGYGNVLSAIAFMHGLATEELTIDELNYTDPQFELLVAGRAIKQSELL
jgi:SAM-dependent methyltransferase